VSRQELSPVFDPLPINKTMTRFFPVAMTALAALASQLHALGADGDTVRYSVLVVILAIVAAAVLFL
jgi:hypothetical protein